MGEMEVEKILISSAREALACITECARLVTQKHDAGTLSMVKNDSQAITNLRNSLHKAEFSLRLLNDHMKGENE